MSFWAYLLHCRGGSFYAGHTDNLDYRIAQHHSGLIPGYTADRLPVELVWSQEFGTRTEALTAKRQIKGWSRAKKMALIRSDWNAMPVLAKSKNNPSTSSGRTDVRGTSESLSSGRTNVRGTSESLSSGRTGKSELGVPQTVRPEPVEGPSFTLQTHPKALAPPPVKLTVTISNSGMQVRYEMHGSIDLIRVATAQAPARRDNLWRTTCFELFVAGSGTAYTEYNFAPSGDWAAYDFVAYRDNMRPAEDSVTIRVERAPEQFILDATLSRPIPPNSPLNLTAVIEEQGGHKSYWALAHPDGQPDFHNRDCFIAHLPPVEPA